MTELQIKYDEVCFEIYKNFVFYIPDFFLDSDYFKDFFISIEQYADKIIYIDNDFNFIFNSEKSLDLSIVFFKSEKLKNNIFRLIDYKESLSAVSFDFISESYLKQVVYISIISNQLLNLFNDKSPDKDSNIKALFIYQSLNFEMHLKEVEMLTGLNANTYDPENMLNDIRQTPFYSKAISQNTEKEISFFEFIIHDQSIEIERIVLDKFINEKGKKLRYLTEYLYELGLVSLVHGDKTKLYHAMKNSFPWDIGTHQSIFGNWFTASDKEYIKFKEVLKSYFPFLQ